MCFVGKGKTKKKYFKGKSILLKRGVQTAYLDMQSAYI